MVFMKGESYWAVPCLTGAKKKIVTVTGRRGNRVTFAKPVPMQVTWNGDFDGREIARATAWWTSEQMAWEEM